MSGPLNNAQFGAIALYRDMVPAFVELFEACGEDFERFYKRAEEISNLKQDQRQQTLVGGSDC